MDVHFYMSADGEVLSNKDYPVNSPTLIVPVMPKPLRVGEDWQTRTLAIESRVFKAHLISVPDKELKRA